MDELLNIQWLKSSQSRIDHRDMDFIELITEQQTDNSVRTVNDQTLNVQGMDGDLKALVAMRERKAKRKEDEDSDDDISADEVASKLKSLVKSNGASSKYGRGSSLNMEKILEMAFSKVDQGQVEALKSVCHEVTAAGKTVQDLIFTKNNETLLHRALKQPEVNIEIIRLLTEWTNNSYISICQQMTIGGKPTKQSVLHMVAENGNVEAAKLIVEKLSVDKFSLEKLTNATTTIMPEGQRPCPMTCLHIAAKNGHDEMVKYFVQSCNMDVDGENNESGTPLMWAASENQPKTVLTLLTLGADVNAQNDKGSSALHWASRSGHAEVVKVLLSKGKNTNINITRRYGLICPLIAASAMGYDDVVDLLLSKGASLENKMKDGQTALHMAASENNLNIVMKLLQKGADLYAEDNQGNTAILQAAARGNHTVVTFLAKCGDEERLLPHKNNMGKSVWDYALETKNVLKALVLHLAEQQKNKKSTDDIIMHFPAGLDPLHSAAASGDLAVLDILFEINMNPLERNKDGQTFIHVAARENQVEILEKYTTRQLCATEDERGDTPLHTACYSSCNEAISILLPLSNLSQTNNYNQTCLHLAVQSTKINPEILEALITQMLLNHEWTVLQGGDRKKQTALHVAVRYGNHKAISLLHHIFPDTVDSYGVNAVQAASKSDDVETMKTLIKTYRSLSKSLDLNAGHPSALFYAVRNHNTEIVKSLVKAGADLAKTDYLGNTVLHCIADYTTEEGTEATHYLRIFECIHSSVVVQWWCRRTGKELPNEYEEEYEQYKRDAMKYLMTDIFNDMNENVLQYAARLAATEYLYAMLNLDNVLRFKDSGNNYTYNVTGLLPMTCPDNQNVAQKARKQAARSPAKHVKLIDADSGYSEDDEENEDKKETHHMSIAELLARSGAFYRVSDILAVSPMKNLILLNKKTHVTFHIVAIMLHMAFMLYHSVASIGYVDCKEKSNQSQNQTTTPGSIEAGPERLGVATYVGIGLIWPVCLLVYHLGRVLLMLLAQCNDNIRADTDWSLKSLFFMRDKEHAVGVLTLRAFGFFYAILSIVWYTLVAIGPCPVPGRELILSMTFIFGWIYTLEFTRGLPQVYHFAIILRQILFEDIPKFALIYLMVLLAFSLAYGAMIKKGIYDDRGGVGFLVFNWMTGMMKFEDQTDFPHYGRLLFSVYIIMSTIILLNLLAAMMFDSYKAVSGKSQVLWTLGNLQQHLEFEWIVIRFKGIPRLLRYEDKSWWLTVPEKAMKPLRKDEDIDMQDIKKRLDVIESNLGNELKSMKKKLQKKDPIQSEESG